MMWKQVALVLMCSLQFSGGQTGDVELKDLSIDITAPGGGRVPAGVDVTSKARVKGVISNPKKKLFIYKVSLRLSDWKFMGTKQYPPTGTPIRFTREESIPFDITVELTNKYYKAKAATLIAEIDGKYQISGPNQPWRKLQGGRLKKKHLIVEDVVLKVKKQNLNPQSLLESKKVNTLYTVELEMENKPFTVDIPLTVVLKMKDDRGNETPEESKSVHIKKDRKTATTTISMIATDYDKKGVVNLKGKVRAFLNGISLANGKSTQKVLIHECDTDAQCQAKNKLKCKMNNKLGVRCCGDPHIVQPIKGTHIPLCYNFFGKPGTAYTFIKQTDLSINVLFGKSSDHKSKYKYITEMAIITPKVTVQVTQQTLTINGVPRGWANDDFEVPGCKVTVFDHAVGLLFHSGVRVIVESDRNHLNINLEESNKIPPHATGVVGYITNNVVFVTNGEDQSEGQGQIKFDSKMAAVSKNLHKNCWQVTKQLTMYGLFDKFKLNNILNN